MRIKLICFFLFIIFTFSINSATYRITLSEQIDNAENYTFIDPIIDSQYNLTGFIYSETEPEQIIIDFFSDDSLINISLDGTPVKTIHYYSENWDSLYIYVLLAVEEKAPQIALIKLSDEKILVEIISTNCYKGYGHLVNVITQDISFQYAKNGTVEGIWFEASIRYALPIDITGFEEEDIPTTILYSLDMQEEQIREKVFSLRAGNLRDENMNEFCSINNYAYRYNFKDFYGDFNQGELKLSAFLIEDEFNNPLKQNFSDQGFYERLFVDNFITRTPYDEIIYYGYTEDLSGIRNGNTNHIACYSFIDATLKEIWFNKIADIDFNYFFKDKHLIAGIKNDNEIILLDYLNGQILDSLELDRNLNNISFFESEAEPRILCLTGQTFDTIFVYQLDLFRKSNSPVSDII
ncbi:MAG: hypothetical protein ACE5D6_03880, partial [Candidatus Zixiibacteriota bacterium]